jgi:hypothetical protein
MLRKLCSLIIKLTAFALENMRSWKLPIIILAVGLLVWAMAGLLPVRIKITKESEKFLSLTIPYVKRIDWYVEIKKWAEVIGQTLSGLGSLAVLAKMVVEVFKRKEK